MKVGLTETFDAEHQGPLALGLKAKRDHSVYHIGLIYRADDAPAQLLHLKGHHRLRVEDPTECKLWVSLNLPNRQLKLLAAKCLNISKHPTNQNLVYSFIYDQAALYFDEDGKYVPGEDGKGLTCATLVMALFEEFAIPLFNSEVWPSEPEDDAWKLMIMEEFRRQGVMSDDHLKAMEENFNCARFRPADIVVASTKKKRPLKQKETRDLHPVLTRKVKKLVEENAKNNSDTNGSRED